MQRFLFLLLSAIVLAADETCDARDSECSQTGYRAQQAKREKRSTEQRLLKLSKLSGKLRPSDLPSPAVFSHWTREYNASLPGAEEGHQVIVKEGSVPQVNDLANASTVIEPRVFAMQGALDRGTVGQILELLRNIQLDSDPDTVDGMPTWEIFVDSMDLYKEGPKVLDTEPKTRKERVKLRKKLKKLLQPALDDILVPFVQQTWPEFCNSTHGGRTRKCTPCYSLIRSYKHGSRQSHATHHDGHAIVTSVVSLSDYGQDYVGGLYVATGHGHVEYLDLNRGDAAVHDSTLLHGVKVFDLPKHPEKTERWSWIVWYKDSAKCEDHSHEWFAACAEDGVALCQSLHSSHVGKVPGIKGGEAATRIMQLNMEAAEKGVGLAAVKVARAYLKQLTSDLPFDVGQARKFYELAIASHNPDGHYGLATLYVASAASNDNSFDGKVKLSRNDKLAMAVRHLEAAAFQGHVFAMFNLGLAHIFGYGMGSMDMELGTSWLVASGLPEGFFAASHHAKSRGDTKLQQQYVKRAEQLGYFAQWRAKAREQTGSGGAAGVDLNLPWPPAPLKGGMQPPRF